MASNVIPLRSPAGAGAGAPTQKMTIPVLKMGSRGGAVLALQKALAKYGFPAGAPDGIFGPSTEEALKALQRKLGVTADGVYGPVTAAAITADLAKPESILKQAAARLTLPTVTPLLTSGEVKPTTTSLPATAPQAQAKSGVPWMLLLAAAGAYFLFKRSREAPTESPEINYAPSDYLDREDDPSEYEDEDEAPKPVKRKRAPRRKRAAAVAVGDVVPAGEPTVVTPEAAVEAVTEAPVDVEWTPVEDAAPTPAAQQTITAQVSEVKPPRKRARKPMSEATKRMLAERKRAQRAAKAAGVAQ